MQADVTIVGVGEELTGFRLAGVSQVIDAGDKSGDEVYESLTQNAGIILLTQEASEKLGEKTEKLKTDNIVLVVSPEKQDANIRKLIKDTVGFELK